MTNTPVYGCDGCRGTLGSEGCPTHRSGFTWSTSQPVLTHCTHGLDLRIHPRCYLCNPALEHGYATGGNLAAPAPSDPGLDVETLARAIHGAQWAGAFHADDHGAEPDETDRRQAASFAAEYARLRGGQE